MKTKKKLRKAIKLYTEAREIADEAEEIFLIERKGCEYLNFRSECHHPFYISRLCNIVFCPYKNKTIKGD